MSAEASRYDAKPEPGRVEQEVPFSSHRSHSDASAIGEVPVQTPGVPVSSSPTRAVPVIEGAVSSDGRAGGAGTTSVASERAGALLRSPLVATSSMARRYPTSSTATVWRRESSPGIAVQAVPVTSQRTHV
jgi:hypothetical protein